ncbi:hypothetical protein TRFO_30134 [Tritrichomonas foetus]|uniref:Leucine Rich Repeat family protein n=1 Tax=Tritrichomonas foetus TaxID=1144522 RepID=A0A1J4JZK8_9EUKA|nr:hypothetical protein TRFO_30134 [Tritrichomonas foetus]|eukprot:OHT02693.1 hypothetical protein TRFO_30134 [Tritrichomonas foetus]
MIKNQNMIDFIFKNETITIKDPNIDSIAKTVYVVLSKIFLKHEMPILNIDQKLMTGSTRKSDMVLDRFIFKAYAANKTITNAIYNDFKNYCNKIISKHSIAQTLDLSRFKNVYQLTDIILDSIFALPNIKRIIIPNPPSSTNSYWPFISKFIATNRTVTTLEIYEPYNPSYFKDFVDSFTQNKMCKINRIGFYNGKFDANFVVQLAVILESHPFIQIALNKGLTQDGFHVLVPMLNSVLGFQSLHNVSMTGSNFLNMNAIVQSLKNVRVFNFSDCELDIAAVLSVFAQNPDSKAKEICLSGNICNSAVPDEINFPPNIIKLTLDCVKWSSNSIINLFKFFSRRTNMNMNNNVKLNNGQQLLSLDISKANMTPKQWNKFDAFLRTFDCNFLLSILFDQNPVGSGFLSCMNRISTLQNVSLNGCFSNGDPMIDSFSDAIAENQSIIKLSVKGIGVNVLAESCTTVLNGLCRNAHLRTVDLSGNSAGNEFCPELLKTLMDNYTITEVFIDGNNVNDPDAYKSMLTELIRVKRCVHINIPTKDLEEMNKDKQELIKMFSLLNQQAKSEESETSMSDVTEMRTSDRVSFVESDNHESMSKVFDERVAEEYVSDLHWESMLDVVPELNMDEMTVGLLQQFTFESLINEIRAHDNV